MSISTIDDSQRTAARIAGFTLLAAIAIVMFGNLYLSVDLIVAGNAVDTARNILAHETRFRISMVCNLLYVANVALLLSALYTILKPVDRNLALVATFFRLVFATMWAITALHMLEALALLGDAPYLKVFGTDQLQGLARMNIRGNFNAYYAGLPFYALASTICSYLWFKSGYIPRALAGFGVIASAWCVLCAFAYLIFPDFDRLVNLWWFDTTYGSYLRNCIGSLASVQGLASIRNGPVS